MMWCKKKVCPYSDANIVNYNAVYQQDIFSSIDWGRTSGLLTRRAWTHHSSLQTDDVSLRDVGVSASPCVPTQYRPTADRQRASSVERGGEEKCVYTDGKLPGES